MDTSCMYSNRDISVIDQGAGFNSRRIGYMEIRWYWRSRLANL